MNVQDSFQTLGNSANGVYKEKGSSFLGYAFPLHTENEVKPIISELRKQHPKARHVCYAYRFGQDPTYFKLNDDGEPSGTAGRPILGQLIKYQLENSLVVVIRYFGGVLLGASRLSTAYKSAAKEAIKQASIISLRRNTVFEFRYDYSHDKLMDSFFKKYEGRIIDKEYVQIIQARIAFPLSLEDLIPTSLFQWNAENQLSIQATFLHRDLF